MINRSHVFNLLSLLFVRFLAIPLFIGLAAGSVSSAEISFSAERDPNVDYRQYLKKLSSKHESGAQATAALTTESIPFFVTYTDLQGAFEYIRDRKTFRWNQMKNSTRRTTFLYPQDGCFLRAALMNRALLTKYVLPLPKIYVFGNLAARSNYDVNKKIFWYFHVALAAQVGAETYVLDPSLNPNHPLLLSDWLGLMGVSEASAEVRLCDPHSYSPFDRCVGSDGSMENKFRENHLQYYLGAEWNNLVKLGLNPYQLLGDAPPWDIVDHLAPQ